MTIPMPQKAFILAGGPGKRLRPYTEKTPKPLLPLGGVTLLERTLNNAHQAGLKDVYISLYFRVDQFRQHLTALQGKLPNTPRVNIIEEEELLSTGGSINNAMRHLSHEPFFILQTNIIWDEKTHPALKDMAAQFDPDRMDALVLLFPSEKAPHYEGRGDYFMDETTHQLRYNQAQQRAPYVAAGIRLVHPRLFKEAPDGAFPLSTLIAQAQANGRLYGLVYSGDWWAIDTKEQFLAAQRHFQTGKTE
jgi:MurNAc alpha-1-phosphate uridylyltransferase